MGDLALHLLFFILLESSEKNISPCQFYPIYNMLSPISGIGTPRIHKTLLLFSQKETEAAKNCLQK